MVSPNHTALFVDSCFAYEESDGVEYRLSLSATCASFNIYEVLNYQLHGLAESHYTYSKVQ